MVTVAPPPSLTAEGVELFKSGTRRDSKGRVRFWSNDELDQIAAAYNEIVGTHDAPAILAPIVEGHQGERAEGWLARAYREGDTLLGDYRDVDPEFAGLVNAGRLRKRSISLYPPNDPDNPTPGAWNIRHVAYVRIPAVKGLKDHAFAEADPFEFEASDFCGADSMVADIFLNLREDLIASDGLERADRLIPRYVIDILRNPPYTNDMSQFVTREDFDRAMVYLNSIGEKLDSLRQWTHNYSETVSPKGQEEMPTEDLQVQFEELTERVEALQTALNDTNKLLGQRNDEIQALQRINAAQALRAERAEVVSFMEGLVQAGKVRPSEKEEYIELAMAMPNDRPEFGEGGGESASIRQRYLNQLEGRTPIWSASRMPTAAFDSPDFEGFGDGLEIEGMDPESIKQDRRIRQKCRDMGKDPNKVTDYAEAMNALGIFY